MKSRFIHLKERAKEMRKQGASLKDIESKLGIPRSTLSGWFKDISLSTKQKKVLRQRQNLALAKARKEAVKWHNNQKEQRIKLAEKEGQKILDRVTFDNNTLEVALALLYLGEGTKAKVETGMGSSDGLILRFFIACLREIYQVPIEKIKCELHLRADQNPEVVRSYWMKELCLPKENFGKPLVDKRTAGKPTYPNYNGVCLVRCGNVAIQRKLMYIAKEFCKQTARKYA